MLELLRIHDLALIENIEMDFSEGMNVLTGETGAGKSFIMKALNFLTGDKLSTDLVRPGKERAVVEALFVINGEDCLLRRELAADSGRSRFYLNDRLCSQETIRDKRASLILHTSQHGQHRLMQSAFQSQILDDFLNRPDLLEARNDVLRQLADLRSQRERLEQSLTGLEEKRELLEFQKQEIEKVDPRPNEEEELETVRAAFRNQADISGNTESALALLHGNEEGPGMLKLVSSLERTVAAIGTVLDDFADLPESLAEMRLALQELDARLRRASAQTADEVDIDAVESRLYVLAQLKRKLKRPMAAIIALGEEITENLELLDSCDLERKRLDAESMRAADRLAGLLAELNPARQQAGESFSLAVQNELRKLGFSEHVRVFFEFQPSPLFPGRDDCDELKARLLWQPNPGQPAQPLDKIASGGELSRFLLAIVSLMSRKREETPTLIFDEVDAGVGGITLNRVAESLEALAETSQMLLITHWPQLAARAARHFVVQKEVVDGQTFTSCRRLAKEEVPAELSRMSGEESRI